MNITKISILRDFQNNLLKRREINAIIKSEKNPGYDNVRKNIAEHFKAGEELIVLNNVRGKFGSRDFFIDSFIYDSVEDKEKIEPKIKIKKEKKEIVKS